MIIVCGNSSTIDGIAPDDDSPCRTERVIHMRAEVDTGEGSKTAREKLARAAGWKKKHRTWYCRLCS